MNVDLLHLKKTLWKSFDAFPSDEDVFYARDLIFGKAVFYIAIPSVFTFGTRLSNLEYSYDVIRVIYNLARIEKIEEVIPRSAIDDAYNLTFNKLKKKELKYLKKNKYNLKDNIMKVIDGVCTEGYLTEQSKWCYSDDFFDVFQMQMFDLNLK